jgi:hypothetical protein
LLTPDGTILAEVPVDSNSWSYFKKETRNMDKICNLVRNDSEAIIHDEAMFDDAIKLKGLLIHY